MGSQPLLLLNRPLLPEVGTGEESKRSVFLEQKGAFTGLLHFLQLLARSRIGSELTHNQPVHGSAHLRSGDYGRVETGLFQSRRIGLQR